MVLRNRGREKIPVLWHIACYLMMFAMGAILTPFSARAETPSVKIAVAISLSGSNATVDKQILDGARMAVDESNASGAVPPVELVVHDDQGTEDGGKAVANQIVVSDALMVIGPGLTNLSVVAGPIYGEAGLASVVPTAYGDVVTSNPTTFRPLFSTSEMGGALTNYLYHVLGGKQAVVIYKDSAFGRPIAAGVKKAGDRLGIKVTTFSYSNAAEALVATQNAAALPDHPAVILASLFDESKPILLGLRRAGVAGPILATSTIATDSFAKLFAGEPEELQKPGYFTEGVYAAAPMLLDSAGAETLAFADRFRHRFNQDPTWRSVQAFDTARMAMASVRHAVAAGKADIRSRRDAARAFLVSLDSPAHALAGITGALWFTADRGRQQAVRIGRFHDGLVESAPLQLLPVSRPAQEDITAGVLVDTGLGTFARRQQVVYSGVYLNKIPRVDVALSTFTADFYLWQRFGHGAGPGAVDPTEIEFPDMVHGSFDAKRMAEAGELPDGTSYRLWHVRGDFKNDFDLHHFPADHQTLAVRFFNSKASSDRLIYALDRRGTLGSAAQQENGSSGGRIAADAFHGLSQWKIVRTAENRDILVTSSPLGDPRRLGVEGIRELSGFAVTIDLSRRSLPTLSKTLLPLGLLCLIMFVTLFFPAGNVMPRVATVITGALTGSVLLSSTNTQLGNVGYLVDIEYVFYLFFFLCLVCLLTVVTAERLRSAGHPPKALKVEAAARWVFLTICTIAVSTAVYFFSAA